LAGSIEAIWIDYTKPRYEDESDRNLEEFERSPRMILRKPLD
jgi:hypothetical protein